MKFVTCTSLFLLLVCASLARARPARDLLQSSSASSVAEAASWVSTNLTSTSPNVQAAASAVAQSAASATSSGSSSSSALASAFVSALVDGNATSGNATAQAYALALTNTSGNANNQQGIAQAYSSAVLSFYQANNVEVRTAPNSVVSSLLLLSQHDKMRCCCVSFLDTTCLANLANVLFCNSLNNVCRQPQLQLLQPCPSTRDLASQQQT